MNEVPGLGLELDFGTGPMHRKNYCCTYRNLMLIYNNYHRMHIPMHRNLSESYFVISQPPISPPKTLF